MKIKSVGNINKRVQKIRELNNTFVLITSQSMYKKAYILLIFILFSALRSQAQAADSALLQDVTVVGYLNNQPLMDVTGAVAVVDTIQMQRLTSQTLLSAMNAQPGVRMEERTPMSYRISLRGSLLRSPFGVRNVKIYYKDFPLTDASGNTYFNVLGRSSVENIEILKGPDGSLFGANSGGVIIVNPKIDDYQNKLQAEVKAGSFGTIEQNVLYRNKKGKNTFRINQSYEKSDGYRNNSRTEKIFADINNRYNYSPEGELNFLGIFSHLNYQTPGGLTKEQWQENPRAARPATPAMPGSAEQKTGTDNKFYFGGISNKYRLADNIQHVASLYSGYADYRNRFITNYETRDEFTFGWRTYFVFTNKKISTVNWEYTIGAEGAQTNAKIFNYDNNSGDAGDVQSHADINTLQHFYFNRLSLQLFDKLKLESGISLNYYKYFFKDDGAENSFKPQWMPRFAINYEILSALNWRATVSKGYSAPTTAEIRPSDNKIYTELQPEFGWNYETGLRLQALDRKLFIDASVFRFNLRSAIVRQTNEAGAEFFVNAGSTKQTGIELLTNYKIISPNDELFFKRLELRTAFTKYFFLFDEYNYDGNDFSGNKITGVPGMMWSNNLYAEFPLGFSLSAYHNYTSHLPLNDANTAHTDPYNLLQIKLSKEVELKKVTLSLNAGVDNILNVQYSLGNDLNAFGNRFYNTAPSRNYWAGLSIKVN